MKPKAKIKRPSPLNWHTLWGFAFLVSLFWSLQVAGVFQQDLVNLGGITLVWQFLKAAFSPNLSAEFLQLTVAATLKTLAFAVCGTSLSVLIGMVGGLLSSQVWWCAVAPNNYRIPWLIIRAGLAIPRSIHEVIWGLFFVNIFGLDPLVAILAIAIPFGTITAKVFSEILDETPRQPLLALLNSGVSPSKAFLYTLIPQAFLNLLSYTFYRFECSIRSAAVLGIIGAGGLGYQILLSLQALRYQEMWTLLIALVVLTGTTDLWSSILRRRLGAPSRLDLHVLATREQATGNRQQGRKFNLFLASVLVKFSAIAAIVLVVFSFWYIQADFSQLLSSRSAHRLVSVWQESFPPDISQLRQLFTLSQQTLAMSILAITLAGWGGILLSFPAANNFLVQEGRRQKAGGRRQEAEGRRQEAEGRREISSEISLTPWWGMIVLVFSRLLLLFTRAVPEPIWALIFLFVLFPGILPGAIALGLHNLGILGRLMAEVTENLDQRPLRSLTALGATRTQVFLYGVLPRTLPRFLAYLLYRWEVCIRSTVIVGLVGAGGLGRLLTEQLTSFDYQGVLTTLIVFISLTFLVDLISAFVRRTLR
ncbi:MAG: ABC transporter permease subunit [Symploca sp. SIO2C1]|nr:ABC transporter permease subunit [Symploca sp. SIO2C1]